MILIKQTEIRIMIIYDMKTEDLINPIGIDEKKPRFSWKLQSKISGTLQTAYRIIVRSDNDTVWDSGKVTSDRSICIEYDGRYLSAMTKYSWQVSVVACIYAFGQRRYFHYGGGNEPSQCRCGHIPFRRFERLGKSS